MKRRLKDINPDWWVRIGIILMVTLVIAMIAASCQSDKKQWPYRIDGRVKTGEGLRPAIWYTDSFTLKGDTLIITNSDRSQWKIAPPYTVTEQPTETIIRHIK